MTAADAAHAGPAPPWDIGQPQAAFVRLPVADALTGASLDAGCGTGEHTILAAAHGAQAPSVDVSQLAIESARHKAAERGIDASFQMLDALNLDMLGSGRCSGDDPQ